jgi:Mrp family chromosome partitioning ATPase
MSTLNKAFIKAYQRRGVGAPHISLSPAPPAAPAPAAEAPEADTLAPVSAETADDGPSTAEPAPPEPAGIAATVPDIAATVPGIATTVPDLTATVPDPQPVQPTEPSPPPADDYLATSGDLFPAFEVERFDWPETVTSLLKNGPHIRALVKELLPEGRGTLLVSGFRRGEGRTCVALLLARHLARSGARVAVLDADLQQPQLAARLGMTIEAGWETILTGEMHPGEALIESLRDRLTLVPLLRAIGESELTGAGARFHELLERLQSQFDVVCIDGGPLAESGETAYEALFGQTQIDAAVIVRDLRHCRLEQTHAVGRKLAQLGVNRCAIVENFCAVGAPPG